jgi:putative tricarboxylic transport membrane protein
MEDVFQALSTALTIANIGWIFAGVTLGYLVGALPGLGKGTATAVAIPLTFYISPLAAIAFLIGISKGSAAGSAVSAILLNTPGEASSTPTAMAGYPLTRAGKAQKALKMGLFASVIGDIGGTVVLILLAQPMATVAMKIGPVELTAILAFSLIFIAGLSGKSMTKGLIGGFLGILLSCVGLEVETGSPRMTFGFLQLYDGLPLIPVVIGLLAMSEMMVQIGKRSELHEENIRNSKATKYEDTIITRDDWKISIRAIIRGTAIGTFVGILPGLGTSVGSFLSYGAARRYSGKGDRFEEEGAIEGVAAAESADNAVVPASFIPLFAIGIPGSVIAAILIGAFIIHGITPGPMMFIEQKELMYGIYASMMLASFALLFVGYFGQNIFARIILLSPALVMPSVVFLCFLGTYLQGWGAFGFGIMIVFAVVGYLAKKYEYSYVTFIIGFVIGPSFELALRQSLSLVHDINKLGEHPIALAFGFLTVIAIWQLSRIKRRQARETKQLSSPSG